jgi:hypothetical protein
LIEQSECGQMVNDIWACIWWIVRRILNSNEFLGSQFNYIMSFKKIFQNTFFIYQFNHKITNKRELEIQNPIYTISFLALEDVDFLKRV